jgi:hypothetical protein
MVRQTGLLGAFVITLTFANFNDCAHAAAAGKHADGRGQGKAAEQMGNKGATNPSAQWSADPERGWVRSDDRHQAKNDATRDNRNKGKARGKKF